MTLTKKFGLGAIVTALFAAMAFAMLASTVEAAAPTTVNVIIDEGNTAVGGDSAADNDSIATSATTAQVVQIVVDVDDTGGMTDETIVTITTQIGTFSNGNTSIAVQCANDGVDNGVVTVDDNDAAATDSGTIVGITEGSFNGTAETADLEDAAAAVQGCAGVAETLIVPAGAATGTYAITAQTTNGISDVDNLVITAAAGGTASAISHVSQSHDAIGYTATGVAPWVNGSLWTVQIADANGAGVDNRQVQFTVTGGAKLVDEDTADGDSNGTITETEINTACATTTSMGTTVFDVSETVGSSVGRGRVVVCGTSAAAGATQTLTATLTGTSTSATDEITVAGEPTAADITVTRSGDTLEVSIMVGGVPAADDTIVQFSPVPSASAVVSSSCVELHDGKASTTVAVAGGTTASVLVTASDDADGSCAAVSIDETYGSKTQQIGGSTAPTTPTGDGTLTAPNFGSGDVGSAVFAGGTIEELSAAVTAAGGTAVWVQGTDGNWYRYNTLATGATAFVNNAFIAQFSAGLSQSAVFVVK